MTLWSYLDRICDLLRDWNLLLAAAADFDALLVSAPISMRSLRVLHVIQE